MGRRLASSHGAARTGNFWILTSSLITIEFWALSVLQDALKQSLDGWCKGRNRTKLEHELKKWVIIQALIFRTSLPWLLCSPHCDKQILSQFYILIFKELTLGIRTCVQRRRQKIGIPTHWKSDWTKNEMCGICLGSNGTHKQSGLQDAIRTCHLPTTVRLSLTFLVGEFR